MDPLSISGSVAGIVALAGTVFSLTAKYIKGVKNAPKEATDLLNEVKNFSVLLHHLSLVASELEITTKDGEEALRDSPNLKWHHIYDCQTILNRIENGLGRVTEDLKSSSTSKKIRSHLKWPFSLDDTKDMIQTIQRHKQTISVALNANSYSRLAICLSRQEAATKRQEETNRRLGGIEDTVKEILDIDTKVVLDERRKLVLDFFAKHANPWNEFEMVQNLHHPLTGLWFTESDDFKEWRATPGSKLWITGIPGAGKSVLAGVAIQECLKLSSADDRRATTYFFCTYRNNATHSARNLLSSMVSQLAKQNEEAFKILEEYYQELLSRKPLAAEPSTKKLLTVFATMCGMFDQVFVVVDGLDECDTDEVVCSLTQLLLKKNTTSISTLLLSRDVVHIRDRLESDFSEIEIEAHTEDIQRYVLAELEVRISSKQLRLRNPELKLEIVDKLVHGAKGMFRWVACQLDYLGELPSDRDKRIALAKLPPTLPTTYERILIRVEQSGKEAQRLVQKTLLLIRASFNKVDYLLEALAIRDDSNTVTEEDMVDEYEIMLRCSSLIRKSANGKSFEFSHFTVQEFLEGIDPTHATLCLYRVSEHMSRNFLIQVCLRYLMLDEFDKQPQADMEYINFIRKRTQTRPLYRYFATFWLDRLWDFVDENLDYNSAEVDSTTMELIRALFSIQKTHSFCQWVIDYADSFASEPARFGHWGDTWVPSYRKRIYDFGKGTRGHVTEKPSLEETRDFVIFVASIIRPDFTPLHMASLLGQPDVCDHLLRQGAKVNLKSRLGTPLHCAVAGFDVFIRTATPARFRLFGTTMDEWKEPLAKNQTVRLLLAAGASAAPRLSTPFQQKTFIGTMHLSPSVFELFPDLLRAGMVIEEEDLLPLQSQLQAEDPSPVILNLLKCLEDIGENSASHEKRSTTTVDRFMERAHFYLNDLTPENIYNKLASETDRLDILKSIIINNNIIALEEMANGSHRELLKTARFNFDGEEWTVVHLACDSSSSDVLELLLEMGIDPEIPTHRGTKPIHLSRTLQDGGDTLRILLRHHVSTMATIGSLGTIWHAGVQNDDIHALKLLVTLASDKADALKVVSGLGQTAICLALETKSRAVVELLLKYCPTPSFWQSNMPLYRQAAQLGSFHVVKKLLDMGIQPDNFDDELGSPLHYIDTRASVRCVELLVDTFPHCYKQRNDGRTPFQSFLIRVIDEDTEIMPEPLTTLLSGFDSSQPEIVKKMVDIWRFFCSAIIRYIPKASREVSWIKQVLIYFIDAGLITYVEEEYKTSAFGLFATELDQALSTLLPKWLTLRQDPFKRFNDRENGRLSTLENWECVSDMLLKLALSKTAFVYSATEHRSITRLLSHAILHDDHNLVKLLLQNGIKVHGRLDSLSALEIACIPGVNISEKTFRCLLSYAEADRLIEQNERLSGYNITHFAGVGRAFEERSPWKLRNILQAGADANAMSSGPAHIPALVLHVLCSHVETAEVLLEFGADPWLADAEGFDAALAATRRNNYPLLKTIEKLSISRKLATKWNATWMDFAAGLSGGNAFHLAARHNSIECMQVYLDEKWLEDLESLDDNLQTPMHYAARFGHRFTIQFLHQNGCNINAIARCGKSPLHLAIEAENLDTVKELLRLGAEMKVDTHGLSPLVYAYRSENSDLIKVIAKRSKKDKLSTFQFSDKGTTKLADAFLVALDKEDLDACQTFIALGFPIDSEMCKPWPVTPLMVALSDNMPFQVVEWLLAKGAKVSIVFEGPDMPKYATALEAAIAKQKYNSLLPTLLHRYLEEQGDFSLLKKTPLHVAVSRENYEGLNILLHELQEISYNVEGIVNQRNSLLGDETALHQAADLDSVDAARLLIINGANLELQDSNGWTPLHYAASSGSLNVLKLLIEKRAYIEPLTLRTRRTPLMLACLNGRVEVARYLLRFEQHITKDARGMDTVSSIAYREIMNESSQLKLGAILFPRGFDLHRADIDGMCVIFRIMACARHLVLRYLLREYPLSLRIQDINWSSSWVQIYLYDGTLSLSHIVRAYRLIHRYLGRGNPLKVSDSVAIGKSSLLYLATSTGLVEAVHNLLSIGIDAESEVCEGATALSIAAAHGQLDVVKYLVRRGANVFNEFSCPQNRACTPTQKKEILKWLVVDRYTDQAKITTVNPDVDEEDIQVRGWAGVIQIGVWLRWEWKKRRAETMLEYAHRLQKIMTALGGEVMNPLVDRENERSEAGSSDEEESGDEDT